MNVRMEMSAALTGTNVGSQPWKCKSVVRGTVWEAEEREKKKGRRREEGEEGGEGGGGAEISGKCNGREAV